MQCTPWYACSVIAHINSTGDYGSRKHMDARAHDETVLDFCYFSCSLAFIASDQQIPKWLEKMLPLNGPLLPGSTCQW